MVYCYLWRKRLCFVPMLASEWLQLLVAECWITVLLADRGVCLTACPAAVTTAELGHRAPLFRLCYLYCSVNKTAAFSP